ncbi:MAG: DUF3857 domain-containing protein [bacterium]|nr:MAG: DUF3857 domain-containing protein [bacterium]
MNRRLALYSCLLFLAAIGSCRRQSFEFLSMDDIDAYELTEAQEDAHTVILLNEERVEITGEREAYWERRIVKKVLESGHPDEGVFAIPENRFAKIISIEARALYPDGTEKILAPGDIETFSSFRDYVLYSDATSRIFRFSGVRPETVLEVHVRKRITNLLYCPPAVFQDELPILERRYRLIHPEDVKVQVHGVNMTETPGTIIEHDDGRIERVWERTAVERFEHKPHMPPREAVVPALWLTVAEGQKLGVELDLSSWEGLGYWYSELSRPSLTPGSRVRDIVARSGVSSMPPKAAAEYLYHEVRSRLRYVSIILGLSGYRPHTAEETLENLYGDCKDQSVVLVSALREAGIPAHLVLVRTADRGRFENPFPHPGYFNHAITAARIGKRVIYLDPTCETCSFGVLPYSVQGADAFVVREGERRLTRLPVGRFRENAYDVASVISVQGSGTAVVRDTITLDGFHASRFRYTYRNRKGTSVEDLAKRLFFDEMPFSAIDSVAIEGLDAESEGVRIVLAYTIPGFLEDRSIVFVNPLLHRLHYPVPQDREYRYPYHLGAGFVSRCLVTLVVAEGRGATGFPDSLSIDNPYFSYTGGWERKGGGFEFTRCFRLEDGIVPVDGIDGVRDAFMAVREFEGAKICFAKEE